MMQGAVLLAKPQKQAEAKEMMVSQQPGAKPSIPKGMAVAQWHHSE